MDFLKSMGSLDLGGLRGSSLKKTRKKDKASKDNNVKKGDKQEKSGSRKVVKAKGDKLGKSTRSTRKPKKKAAETAGPAQASQPPTIFDPSTFTFNIEKTITPEPGGHTAIQKTAFEAFAQTIISAGVPGLIKEYVELIQFIPTGCYDRAIFDQNTELKKNRYKDVVCNDMTRVILRDGRPGDYIHANYVKGLKPMYILTQGPIKDSLADFWRMVMQEQVAAICMLCELVENGRTKCETYYPENCGETAMFGDFAVTCNETNAPDTHTQLRVFTVVDRKIGKTCKVNHYKIVTWPDKTVAVSNLSILRTHRLLRKFNGSIVVHCSAGVGRTGTFAAIEIGIQLLLNGKQFKLNELVRALRHCRLNSVQMDTQYLMLADTILDCGVNFKYITDTSLIDAIAVHKTKTIEYVEAHPPPAEPPQKAKDAGVTVFDKGPDDNQNQPHATSPNPQAQVPMNLPPAPAPVPAPVPIPIQTVVRPPIPNPVPPSPPHPMPQMVHHPPQSPIQPVVHHPPQPPIQQMAHPPQPPNQQVPHPPQPPPPPAAHPPIPQQLQPQSPRPPNRGGVACSQYL